MKKVCWWVSSNSEEPMTNGQSLPLARVYQDTDVSNGGIIWFAEYLSPDWLFELHRTEKGAMKFIEDKAKSLGFSMLETKLHNFI